MGNRYSNIFRLKQNYYAVNSPVIIAAGSIDYDNLKNFPFIRLKFKNISDTTVTGISVVLNICDEKNDNIKIVNHSYTNISLASAETLGENVAIELPLKDVSSFAVVKVCIQTLGEDSISEFDEWAPISQKIISTRLPRPLQQA